jgi:hypothetical protein
VHREHDAITMRRLEEIFPSWSWASHIGRARYPDELNQLKPEAVFEDFIVHPMDVDNSSGWRCAVHGFLALKAFVKPMTDLKWVCTKQEDVLNFANSRFLSAREVWKLYYRRTYIGWGAMDGTYLGLDHSSLSCAFVASRWPKYDANPTRYCRECAKTDGRHYTDHTESIDFMYYYVLILRCSGDGFFKRVGIGKLYESSWFPAHLPVSDMDEIILA